MRKRIIYVEALDKRTNQAFADYLDEALKTEISLRKGGEPIKVWEATEKEYAFLRRSRADMPLEFNEYVLSPGERYARKLGRGHKKLQKIRAVRSAVRAIKGKRSVKGFRAQPA